MPVHHLSKQNSVLSVFINELRDQTIQKDRMRFRRNMERTGEIIAYEISKTLSYRPLETETPLGMAQCVELEQQPVLATILRAGLPLHQGMMNYFDGADSAFISAYRKHHKDETFDIEIEYLSSPSIDGKTLILCDPMLATGSSMVLAYKAMLQRGIPSHVHIVSVIASSEGVNFVKKHMPLTTTIWLGAVDEELTAQAYIVPGLGDAGDLSFGEKV
ncbi:MAG: uracil phosphoribosyltransferase [Bacteroidota bacterium]